MPKIFPIHSFLQCILKLSKISDTRIFFFTVFHTGVVTLPNQNNLSLSRMCDANNFDVTIYENATNRSEMYENLLVHIETTIHGGNGYIALFL